LILEKLFDTFNGDAAHILRQCVVRGKLSSRLRLPEQRVRPITRPMLD
jgi:hypothetical protein